MPSTGLTHWGTHERRAALPFLPHNGGSERRATTISWLPQPPGPRKKGRWVHAWGPARSSQPHPQSLVEDRVQIPFLHRRLALALLIREEVAFDVTGAWEGRRGPELNGGPSQRLPPPPGGASPVPAPAQSTASGQRFPGVLSLNPRASQGR